MQAKRDMKHFYTMIGALYLSAHGKVLDDCKYLTYFDAGILL